MDAYADALGIPGAPAGSDTPRTPQQRATSDVAALQREIALARTAPDAPQAKAMRLQILTSELQKKQAQTQPAGAPAAAAPDPYADALGIGGGPAPAAAPATAQAAPQRPTLSQRLGAETATSNMGTVGEQLRSVAANQLTGLGANIVGGYKGLATLLTGGSTDDAANTVRDYVASHTYTPDAGTPGAKAIESYSSPLNPQNMPSEALEWAGGKVAQATGSPALGAVLNAGGNAALLALGLRGKPGIAAPIEGGPGRPAVGAFRPLQLGDNPTGQALQPVMPRPAAPVGATAAPVTPAAAPVPTTPQAVQQVAQTAPATLFPETPTSAPNGGTFASADQQARARILQSIGIENARRSSLAGDGVGGSTDFQTSKLDSPAGRQMRAQLDNERNALVNHADSLISDTGGTHGVDSPALYARGNTIVAPLDGLKQWFDDKTSALYKAADERAQGVPTTLSNFATVLGDASELTNSDRVHLQGAVNAYIKKLGMAGEDGAVAGSAQQAETIRKYLNEQWSPQNSKLVGKLKDALDEDVTASAGDDIYAEARKVRTLRAQTLDNPNGIAKLMDSSGPQGINRAVPVEKIADSLAGMPVDQFAHVAKTLREAPPELQPQAQAALAEIKAHFANRVQAVGSSQAGQWNAKGVTKYLQNNAARMAQVFTPEEIAKFRNLNDAGHIVAKDQSYPGAAVQGHNLITHGVMSGLPTVGAAAGGYVGGPVGAAVGGAAGRMAAGAVENAATLRAVKKRTVPLSELLDVGRGQ